MLFSASELEGVEEVQQVCGVVLMTFAIGSPIPEHISTCGNK